MNKTTFRIYVVADEKMQGRLKEFEAAFDILIKDYEVVYGLTVSYDLTFESFENVPWEDYWKDGKSFGVKKT